MNWRGGVIRYLFTLLHTEETIPSGCVHTAALMCFPDHFYCYVTVVGIENKSALELSWKHIGFWIPFERLIIGSIYQKYCLFAMKKIPNLRHWRGCGEMFFEGRYHVDIGLHLHVIFMFSVSGPGPGRYGLPSTVGSKNHDPCKHMKPAYSFGHRLPSSK